MQQTLIDRITQKRMRPGKSGLLSIADTAKEIGIGVSSLRSVLKYGELAAGETILPKIEKWLQAKMQEGRKKK